MAVTPQPELLAQAKVAELERVQRHVDKTAWAGSPANVGPLPAIRRRVGQRVIRLGIWIAGTTSPASSPRPRPHRLWSTRA